VLRELGAVRVCAPKRSLVVALQVGLERFSEERNPTSMVGEPAQSRNRDPELLAAEHRLRLEAIHHRANS
jgi:hypothetical protein